MSSKWRRCLCGLLSRRVVKVLKDRLHDSMKTFYFNLLSCVCVGSLFLTSLKLSFHPYILPKNCVFPIYDSVSAKYHMFSFHKSRQFLSRLYYFILGELRRSFHLLDLLRINTTVHTKACDMYPAWWRQCRFFIKAIVLCVSTQNIWTSEKRSSCLGLHADIFNCIKRTHLNTEFVLELSQRKQWVLISPTGNRKHISAQMELGNSYQPEQLQKLHFIIFFTLS